MAADSRTAPRISVVVPAYNEARLIEGCLDSIARAFADAGMAPADYELIVVDNASTDDTAVRARSAGAGVVVEPVRQIGRARNRGAREARGRWLLFVDADSWPGGALMADMLAAMEDPAIAGGGALVRMGHRAALLTAGVAAWNLCSRWMRWASGAFIFCRRDIFEALGGFDPALFVGEEIGFSRRLKRYARRRGSRVVILTRNPLRTSARKGELYSQRELITAGLRMLRHPWRFFRDPGLCSLWYDGRR